MICLLNKSYERNMHEIFVLLVFKYQNKIITIIIKYNFLQAQH